MLIMKSGKQHMTEGIELPNHKIKTLRKLEISKYLEILETITIEHAEMKEKYFLNTSGEQDNYLKPNYIAEISSKI